MKRTLFPTDLNQVELTTLSLNDWQTLLEAYHCLGETELVKNLVATLPESLISQASDEAAATIKQLRKGRKKLPLYDQFMQEYNLNSEEGLTLMIMAEALLRIPDKATRDAFISSEMGQSDWAKHLSHSDFPWVNLATRGLNLGGKISRASNQVAKLLATPGKPIVRQALQGAMKMMANQFVLGQDIEDAVKNSRKLHSKETCFSFDMLGEAALTSMDAERYLDAYRQALAHIAKSKKDDKAPCSLSIKLSALHPRYEELQREDVLSVLGARLAVLVKEARKFNVPVTLDAEEADRLDLSLTLFEQVFRNEAAHWGGLGLAVQAYGKRTFPVLGWINQLAIELDTHIPVRLVKGAYWDNEIKHAQQMGLSSYPVYTRKCYTDISYLACAQFMFKTTGLKPQFATHNAHSIAAIRLLGMKYNRDYEFQRLQGMGEQLYHNWQTNEPLPLRIYAPVGNHKDLLPYLVRRLLENGANSSFVHHLWDEGIAAEELAESPLDQAKEHQYSANPATPLPAQIFSDRTNSQGINLNNKTEREKLEADLRKYQKNQWYAQPILALSRSCTLKGDHRAITPYSVQTLVGKSLWFDPIEAPLVTSAAQDGFDRWRQTPREAFAQLRITWLNTLADLLEANRTELIALCTLEAGKTRQDSIDEVREAVDFCRYYANQINLGFTTPISLPGPTGESNQLVYEGKGVWLCISPWNFPLAIFLGQIAAALAAGNAVIAKPAEATSLIAAKATELAHQAGIPRELLQLVPGSGRNLGEAFISDPRIVGVAFTGSDITAKEIAKQLAQRNGPIATLIAETGGQNAMIVDSSALPEQVVRDVMRSAFSSAGQRCSALRILCLQEDIADTTLELLTGAMAELTIGDPNCLKTDIGPVISVRAQQQLQNHKRWLQAHGKLIAKANTPPEEGTFITPVAFEIDKINDLSDEHFGPILHVVRYKASELDALIADINQTGFGLTLSIHSRNQETVDHICQRARVGNIYVNRDQIGAVVGVQPFGGMGKSGTGPKAGGPNYMLRFATEKTVTVNTSATGGNPELLRGG